MDMIRAAVLQHAMQADMDLNAGTAVRMIAEESEVRGPEGEYICMAGAPSVVAS